MAPLLLLLSSVEDELVMALTPTEVNVTGTVTTEPLDVTREEDVKTVEVVEKDVVVGVLEMLLTEVRVSELSLLLLEPPSFALQVVPYKVSSEVAVDSSKFVMKAVEVTSKPGSTVVTVTVAQTVSWHVVVS